MARYSPVPGARESSPFMGGFRRTGGHSGVDYAAAAGTPISAAVPGTVMSVGDGGAYGNLIKVRHDDGTLGYYAHMQSTAARPGQRIQRGSFLGRVGSTGNSTGPHLHFEVRRNGQPVDPLGWLQADYEASPERARDIAAGEPLTYEDPFSRTSRSAPSTLGGGFYHGEEFDIETQLEEELPAETTQAEMEMV